MILINQMPSMRPFHIYTTVITIFYLLSTYHSLPHPNNSLQSRALSIGKDLGEAGEQAKTASTASATTRLPQIGEHIPETHSAELPSLGHSHLTQERPLPPIHQLSHSKFHSSSVDLPDVSPKPHEPKLETVSKPTFFKEQVTRFKK